MANYEKNIDYKALMDEAVARGDYLAAAQYEQQRNAKIEGEGLGDYGATTDYAGNLDTTDYSTQLQQMLAAGASSDEVKGVLDKRTNKANSAINLQQYTYDDKYKAANDYIKQMSLEELTYADAPEYISRNQEQIDAMMEQLLNSSYSDFLGTDEYAALDRNYTRNAQRSMQDTVGDVSARTGGLASSYATTAGQQAYGNQMSALEMAAMDMYGQDKSDQLNNLQMMLGVEGMDYGKYQGELSQYNADRGLGYGAIQDRLNNEYKQTIDERNWNYQMEQDAQGLLTDKANLMANAGQYQYLKELLGLTDADVAALVAANAPTYSGSGGGSKIYRSSPPKKKEKEADGGTTPVDDPSSLATLYNKLSRIEDKGVAVVSNATHLIWNYYDSKLITNETKKKLLKNYGVNG